jgi:hypothetical protein
MSGFDGNDVLELSDSDVNLGDREFNTTSRDPIGRFEAKEDGTYRVELRDLFSPTVANPRNTYRLSIRRETPDFRLVAQTVTPKYKGDAKNIEFGFPVLRRGETLPIRVMAFRRDGFEMPHFHMADKAQRVADCSDMRNSSANKRKSVVT